MAEFQPLLLLTKKFCRYIRLPQPKQFQKRNMIGLSISLFAFALFAPSSAETITSSLSKSLEAQVHGRQLAHHRKLLTIVDPTKALDGRYIAVFDYDAVQNVTEKVESMFGMEQVLYEYDNIALKGAAIQNVTAEQLEQMEIDPDILYIAPVRVCHTDALFTLYIPPHLRNQRLR